jgi:uncharacterized protein YkwD
MHLLKKAKLPKDSDAKPRAYSGKTAMVAGPPMEHTEYKIIVSRMFRPDRKLGGNKMKRLIFVSLAILTILAMNIAMPLTATAAGANTITSLDANSLIGMSAQQLKAQYGSPARVEPSEYNFNWYVYNRDYKNFFMAGVRGNVVVAVYTNAKTLNYAGKFKLGSSASAVRGSLGSPVSYVRSGNTVFILNNADEKDVIPVGDNYLIAFYDTVKGGGVTALMIVPQSEEDNALINHPALSDSLVAAYQRINVDLVNSIRVRNGLKKLTVDSKDTALAVSRSKDMRDRNYFDHYTPDNKSPDDQAKKMGMKYTLLGENIAYGNHNAMLAHEAFMDSAGHRSNILRSNFTKIGAGVAYGGSRYILLTDIFTK